MDYDQKLRAIVARVVKYGRVAIVLGEKEVRIVSNPYRVEWTYMQVTRDGKTYPQAGVRFSFEDAPAETILEPFEVFSYKGMEHL